MRWFFLMILIFLSGCSEKHTPPVGQEYLLISDAVPMPITLGFNPDGRFYGKAVNEYWGQYHIRDHVISFSGITHTMNSDILPKMRAERLYFDHLNSGHSFEIKEGVFKIFFDETGVLEFRLNHH